MYAEELGRKVECTLQVLGCRKEATAVVSQYGVAGTGKAGRTQETRNQSDMMVWKTGDMAYTVDGVDIGFEAEPSIFFRYDGELWSRGNGEDRRIRFRSDLFTNPWYLEEEEGRVSAAARARSTIDKFIACVASGEIEMSQGDGGAGCLFFDQPLPYHLEFQIPREVDVVPSGTKD